MVPISPNYYGKYSYYNLLFMKSYIDQRVIDYKKNKKSYQDSFSWRADFRQRILINGYILNSSVLQFKTFLNYCFRLLKCWLEHNMRENRAFLIVQMSVKILNFHL